MLLPVASKLKCFYLVWICYATDNRDWIQWRVPPQIKLHLCSHFELHSLNELINVWGQPSTKIHRLLGIRKEGNVLFNDALNTFYLRLYGVRHMVKGHSDSEKGNIGYSFRLTARVLLYAPSHRQDSTYHELCYTNRGALAGTRNSSMGSSHEGSIRQPITPRANTLTTELHLAPAWHQIKVYIIKLSI